MYAPIDMAWTMTSLYQAKSDFKHHGYIFSKAPGTGRPQEVEEVAGNLQNVPAPGGVEMDVLASRARFAEQPGEQKYQDRRWEVLTVRWLLQWGLPLISGPGGLALPKVKAWCQSSAGQKSPHQHPWPWWTTESVFWSSWNNASVAYCWISQSFSLFILHYKG